jgi:AraC-like DNA-binding protein
MVLSIQPSALPTMNSTDVTTLKGFIARLAQSSLFLRYRDAFGLTTGRTLSLQPVSKENKADAPELPFVTVLRAPVEIGGHVAAHLALDGVRISDGEFSTFDDVARHMLEDGATAAEVRAAQAKFGKVQPVTRERCDALATMLSLFAGQLGEFGEKLFLQSVDTDPDAVRKGKQFILEHLTEPLGLDEVSEHAGVSPFHFCKVFKRTTGLTFTEFVNRARVEHAKRLLLKPQARITEVAYDVGFQSLSQFNRSFRRVTDKSPTEFRSGLKDGRRDLVSA